MEENRGVEGIGGCLYSLDREGGTHCRGSIWANFCMEPKVRTNKKACVGKNFVCLGTASNGSDWDFRK